MAFLFLVSRMEEATEKSKKLPVVCGTILLYPTKQFLAKLGLYNSLFRK
jgi:hypothetical protein